LRHQYDSDPAMNGHRRATSQVISNDRACDI
jgi:hypothetical protein